MTATTDDDHARPRMKASNALSQLALSALIGCALTHGVAHAQAEQVGLGQELAQAHCAACHAIASHGDSPNVEAPPLRTLSRHYEIADLQEALAEGISVGHPAMPAFQFSADDVDALIAYLQSVQEPPSPTR